MTEERLIDIETKLAHLDQALHELNTAVTRQQDSLTRLERLFAALTERVAGMHAAQGAGRGESEMPPHY